MLTLFILKSGQPEADSKRASESFGFVVSKVIEVNSLEDVINAEEVKTPWYGICYDNEYADEGLKVSLKLFLTHSDADVLVLYKKHPENASKSSRLFRKNVRVRSDCLKPEYAYALKIDAILNGWII